MEIDSYWSLLHLAQKLIGVGKKGIDRFLIIYGLGHKNKKFYDEERRSILLIEIGLIASAKKKGG